MVRYAALLRGVNVNGITIRMAELAALVESLGYRNVRTILASGNVLLDTEEAASTVTERLQDALRTAFGYDAWVQVIPQQALAAIARDFPFAETPLMQPYVVFCTSDAIRDELLAAGADPDSDVEQLASGVGVLYWTVTKGATISSDFGRVVGRARFKQTTTSRNLRTVRKLLE